MLTQIAPVTFRYSHTIGRQEVRSGNGFNHPSAIAHDKDGLLYVLSRSTETRAFDPGKRVTVFTAEEEFLWEFGRKVGPEDATREATPDGSFMWPTSVALDSQKNVYVADEWLNRISIFTNQGDWISKWGTPGGGNGELNRPSGMAFDENDNLYLVDSLNHRIQVFTTDGKFLSKWGCKGSGEGEFDHPWGITIDPNGDVFIADWRNDRIQKFSPDGKFLMTFGSSGQGDGEFNRPTGVAVDRDGIIYVADWKNERVQIFDTAGRFVTKLTGEATLSKWGKERVDLDPLAPLAREMAQNLYEREKVFQGPIALTVDDQNRLFVAEVARHRVQVFQKQSGIFQGGLL